jgi:hypothetical protein
MSVTTEQLRMLSDALCFCFFGISIMTIITMKTKRYGRRLARKWVRKNGINFNNELSLMLNGGESGNDGSVDEGRKPRDRKIRAGEKRLKGAYAVAGRLAEQGLNVQGIQEKVDLPRNEIELIVKLRKMNGPHSKPHSNRDEESGTEDCRTRGLDALRNASEKIAHAGTGRN